VKLILIDQGTVLNIILLNGKERSFLLGSWLHANEEKEIAWFASLLYDFVVSLQLKYYVTFKFKENGILKRRFF